MSKLDELAAAARKLAIDVNVLYLEILAEQRAQRERVFGPEPVEARR